MSYASVGPLDRCFSILRIFLCNVAIISSGDITSIGLFAHRAELANPADRHIKNRRENQPEQGNTGPFIPLILQNDFTLRTKYQ